MRSFKVLMLGDGNVGKTSLANRFVRSSFSGRYKTTIGVEILKKDLNDIDCELQIWDLAGQSQFKNIRGRFYKGSSCGLLVFDLTNRDSFSNLDTWLDEVKMNSGHIPLCLVGNKSDLDDLITISDEEIQTFSSKHDLLISNIKTSALTGENVVDAYRELIKTVMEKKNLISELPQ